MRISTNSIPNELIRYLQDQNAKQLDLQSQLIKRQRITKGSDDPLAFREVSKVQSDQRALRAYRANMDRAELIANLTESDLDYFKNIVRDSLNTTDMIETSITDRVAMETNANLVNDLLEQLIETLNTKNGDQYLFSGSTITQKPFEVLRDDNGEVSFDATISYDTGDAAAPELISGATYQIVNLGANTNIFDNSGANAGSAAVGDVFTYNGTAPAWVQGDTAALVQVAPSITETTADRLVIGKAYEIVSPGTSSDFTDSGAINNSAGTQFIYNGSLPTWDGAELIPLQVDDSLLIDDPYELSTGALYKIAAASGNGAELPNISEADRTNAPNIPAGYTVQSGTTVIANIAGDYSSLGGPAAANAGDVFTTTATNGVPTGLELLEAPLQAGKIYRIEVVGNNTDTTGIDPNPEVGDVFVSDGTQPTTWDGLQLKALYVPTYDTVIASGTTIGANKTVQISTAGDFSAVGGPAAGAIGQIFTTTQAGAFASGALKELVPTEGQGDLTSSDYYTIDTTIAAGTNVTAGTTLKVTTAGDFSAVGGPAAAQVGEIFTTTTTAAFASGDAKELVYDVGSQSILHQGESYVIGNLGSTATATLDITLNDIATGATSLVVGSTYKIASNGSSADFTNMGAAARWPEVGETFVATIPPTGNVHFGGATLVEINPATGQEITGVPISQLQDDDGNYNLTNGATYQVVDNGSSFDVKLSGSTGNTVGTTFTYNGINPSLTSNAYLTEVGGDGTIIHNADDMVAGKTYRIASNIRGADFIASGASSNEVGTEFVYNGTQPALGAKIQLQLNGSDFTAAGAVSNTEGLYFTADGDAVSFGVGATVFQLFPERGTGADFTQSGATSNSVGNVFAYNGTAPDFGGVGEELGAVVAYTRERLAAAYVGSDANFTFQVAEDKIMSPFQEGSRNRELEAFVNAMVQLRDAYDLAADAEENDLLTRDIALERAKEAATTLGNSEVDILEAIADMGITRLSMEVAIAKDDNIYDYQEKNKARMIDIDEAEITTRLTQSLDAYEASLQSSARTLQLSLLQYL